VNDVWRWCGETWSSQLQAFGPRMKTEDTDGTRRRRETAWRASFDVPPFERRALGDQVVTRRWVEVADVRGVAIDAGESAVFIERGEFVVEILSQAFTVVTLGAGGDRHIGFEAAQRR